MPIEVVIGIPADEGVRGVIVHGHARAILQVFHALENGKGGEDSKEKEKKKKKTDQQLEKQRKPTSSPRMLPKGLLIFLTMRGGTSGLSWMENPGVWFLTFLKKLSPGHKGKSGQQH